MKTKTDFVTNSSCASFVIDCDKLTELQKYMIKNHIKIANDFEGRKKHIKYDQWIIEEYDGELHGETSMDNFDMLWFLTMIGLKSEDYQYEGCY